MASDEREWVECDECCGEGGYWREPCLPVCGPPTLEESQRRELLLDFIFAPVLKLIVEAVEASGQSISIDRKLK